LAAVKEWLVFIVGAADLLRREFLSLTVLPSRNGDHHIKKKDEEWDHRRLNTEWQYLGRNSGLKVDIDCHKHLKDEA
jgi:hypothetical protein